MSDLNDTQFAGAASEPGSTEANPDEALQEVETPKLTPAERRANFIDSRLGTRTGWEFVERFTNEGEGHDEITNARLINGVVLRHKESGRMIRVGEGFMKKYTDARIPKREAAPKAEKAAKATKAGSKKATRKAVEVEELTPEAQEALQKLTDELGV